jgi:hypothetical protein
MSMKRTPQWYAEHQAKMQRISNIELVELVPAQKFGRPPEVKPKRTPVVSQKERYPNLLILLHEAGIPPPVTEYPFAGNRRWRFDYAWPYNGARVALEVDGGVWTNGRHVRGRGFIEDQDKRNAATMLGWRVIHTTPDRLEDAVRCIRTLLRSEDIAA